MNEFLASKSDSEYVHHVIDGWMKSATMNAVFERNKEKEKEKEKGGKYCTDVRSQTAKVHRYTCMHAVEQKPINRHRSTTTYRQVPFDTR